MNTFKQKKGGIANKMDVKEKTKEAEELEILEIEENIDKKKSTNWKNKIQNNNQNINFCNNSFISYVIYLML